MLSFARKKATKWVAFLILFMVLVAMVVTGFGTDGVGGLGSLGGGASKAEALATVEGREVTASEVNDLINRAICRRAGPAARPRR